MMLCYERKHAFRGFISCYQSSLLTFSEYSCLSIAVTPSVFLSENNPEFTVARSPTSRENYWFFFVSIIKECTSRHVANDSATTSELVTCPGC
jgi:hypothetical protein